MGQQSQLAQFEREEFLRERWSHEPGEQVLISEPTQGGKTRFAFELLDVTPHIRPPVALVMKPRDPTPAAMTRKYGWKEIQAWPPPRLMPWQAKPPGYTLWPRHTMSRDPASIARSNENLKRQFEACLLDTYRHGDRNVFVDEIIGMVAELDMRELVLALSNRGSGMGAALWGATQKASGTIGQPMLTPLLNNPTHKFFGYDDVEANRKVIAKITGINSALVESELENLETFPIQTPYKIAHVSEKLYVNKNGPRGGYMCIVGVH
jgi:hypothetical protein